MREIVQQEDAVLRKEAEAVRVEDIPAPSIQKVLKDMAEAVESQEDGVAIAAPQLGISLRIFLVSHRAFELDEDYDEEKDGVAKDLIFINPEIIKHSKKTAWMDEGCLSVRWLYGEVKRSKQVTLKAYDGEGKEFTRGAGGLLAQIFQHETDHLNGILFTDKAKKVQEILPQKHKEGGPPQM